MICSKCGYNNDSFETICQKCNSPLNGSLLICPHCGKIIKDGTEICPRCKKEVFIREVKKDTIVIREAYTPKYIVDDHLSLLSIIGIMIFMVYSLIFNIYVYINDLINVYQNSEILIRILLLFSKDIRILVLIPLSVLSIYTFVFRLKINKVTTYEDMSNRLVILKCLLLADSVAFFTYFFVSFWPSTFSIEGETKPYIYYIGAFIGVVQLIITSISLPWFYKKAKIRTR